MKTKVIHSWTAYETRQPWMNKTKVIHTAGAYHTQRNWMSKTKVIHSRTAYATDRDHTSRNNKQVFIYPVVYSIKVCGTPTFYWSSCNNRGHFGIPKVIWGYGASGIIVDQEGKYGLSQFASAIVDDPENLEDIAKAMKTKKFIGIMKAAGITCDRYPYRIIAELRHDFWREFL